VIDFRRPVVMTGGCGFIASHLVRRLLPRHPSLRLLDDFSTGFPEGLPAHQQHHQNHRDLTIHRGSVLDRDLLREVLHGAEAVFHLAGSAATRTDAAEGRKAYETAVEGTRNVLDLSGDAPVVIFSSAVLYPPQGDGPANGSISPADALALDGGTQGYACGKLRAEELALAAAAQGRRVLIIRPFNVIGPGQRSVTGAVVPIFFRSALRGEPLRVRAGQERYFTAVTTFAECLLDLVAMSAAWAPGDSGGNLLGIGADTAVPIADLAAKIVALTGSRSEVVLVPVPEESPSPAESTPRPDAERLRKLLGRPVRWPAIDDMLVEIQADEIQAAEIWPQGTNR
jgi:UDP-glucose 4-epimerase